MPLESQAQNRLFHWADAHPAEAAARGIKPGVAREFIAATPAGSVKRLPERAGMKKRPKAEPAPFGFAP